MLEVHRNVVASNIGGHRDDWCVVELPNQVARRNAIQVRHDDIHENQIILRAGVELVDSF